MKKNILRYLEWYHWLVVALSLALTLTAWQVTKIQAEEKAYNRFKFQSDQVIELINERMAKYEEALWAGVAMLHVMPDSVTRAQWNTFAASLNIEQRFPGINGIGVIHYVPLDKQDSYISWQTQSFEGFAPYPDHNQSEWWPISYIEPESANSKAVGLDMAHEENRYTAALKARYERTTQVTGPITLVQDQRKTPGFLLFAPWYSDSIPPYYGDSESGFAGLVYAPFIVERLMGGALSNFNDLIGFSIYDGEDKLYEDISVTVGDFSPMFSESRNIDMYGRTWTFNLRASPEFTSQTETSEPTIILVTGLVIDALLIALFIALSRTKNKATELAERTTRHLKKRKDELEKTKSKLLKQNEELSEANKELDRFAFVASHDLKAPLRGVAQLSEWIESDKENSLSATSKEYFSLLRSRILRLERLLNALLQYSRVDKKQQPEEVIDFEALVEETFNLNSPPKGFRLELDSNIGELVTDKESLSRVLGNIINNSVKHHDKENGTVSVSSTYTDKGVEIRVSDDGPGVAEEFKEKVFELFHTLRPRDEVEGSGLGLAIVRKIVEKRGGSCQIEQNLPRGVTFVIHWVIAR
tara:strand:+ start:2850 stop:4607 length:1758 start_codon:yes stop_codon:yes gene_type:complete